MSLPARSVTRPIAVLTIALAVVVFGLLSAERLPVELLPDVAYPTLTVQTTYPDAAPVSVEQFVTRPIEETVGVIPGVSEMRSVSRAGLSEVVLRFEWGERMDFAAMEVRERLGLVELPREADPPRVLRYDPSLEPVVRVAFLGERPLDELRQLAERWAKPRLEATEGVAAAVVRGGLVPEIVVEADEARLAAYDLALDELAAALREENVNRPGGVLKDRGTVFLVRTLHEFDELEELREALVREGAGGRVRVEDVAEVRRGHRDREELVRAEGREGVELALYREGSANTIEVARAIRASVDALANEAQDDLSFVLLSDRSLFIASAVDEVWSAALIGGLLAIAVLFFFLRDPLPTIIVALAIPTSVVAAFLAMGPAGVTLNVMSLGGLALGVGMLVDNAIVVLEAIDRRRRAGLSRVAAAARGAGEVAGAVTAATATTLCVFLPIVFVEGIAGQLFYDLAVTVCLSLGASLLVSLTVIPALSGLGPERRGDEREEDARPAPLLSAFGLELPRLFPSDAAAPARALEWLLFAPRLLLFGVLVALLAIWRVAYRVFAALTWPAAKLVEAIAALYPRVLRGALRARWLVVAGAFALFVLALFGAERLGRDLVPDLAQGELAFRLELPEGTPLEATAESVAAIEAALAADPDVERVFSLAGSLPSSASGRQSIGENLAQVDVVLSEGPEVSEEAFVARARAVLGGFPRVEAELVRPAVMTLEAPVAVRVFADDLERLGRGARVVESALAEMRGLDDVRSTWEEGSPELRVVPDRERAGALGVRAEDLAQALRGKVRGDLVGLYRDGEERIDIRLRVAERDRDRGSEIGRLGVRLADGSVVPLEAVATIVEERGPAAVHRAGGARMAEVTAQVGAADLGATLERVREEVAGLDLPPGVVAELAGQDEELASSVASLALALALAVFLVYVVMAVQFESLLHPFVILLSVPLGLIGVVGALLATDTTISVLALIGVVMLAGIVVNNAIVLVDAVNRRRREEGAGLEEALLGAGRERLRPILMTTATTILGLLPMALGLGEGSELRRPLAVTVIGGLAVATLLTLVVVPCLYRLLASGLARRRIDALEEAEPALAGGPTAGPSGVTQSLASRSEGRS